MSEEISNGDSKPVLSFRGFGTWIRYVHNPYAVQSMLTSRCKPLRRDCFLVDITFLLMYKGCTTKAVVQCREQLVGTYKYIHQRLSKDYCELIGSRRNRYLLFAGREQFKLN